MSLINYVTKIHFAESVLEDALEAELELLAIRRPFVVADDAAARAGIVERLCAAIPRSAAHRLFEVEPGVATERDCEAAAIRFADHRADGIIGFGGSASIALAKAVGLRLSRKGALGTMRGLQAPAALLDGSIPPLIAVPTTAASCPEAIGPAVLSVRKGPHLALTGPHLIPKVVICDPTLTLDLPVRHAASAGMDALTHCLETYIATAYNPPADGIARDGLRRAVASLEKVVAGEDDLAARREMMAAALNGALAGQKGLGGVHAMSHALGSVRDGGIDHGAANGVLLPHVLEFNAPAVAPRYAQVAELLDLGRGADLSEAIIRLRERLALPSSLRDLGVEEGDIERASLFAEADYANRTNPRRADAADYRAMLTAAC